LADQLRARAQKRVLIEWALVAFAATFAVCLLVVTRATTRADYVIYDALSKLAVRPPDDDIVIIAIDNRSISQLGRWPWPRSHHAQLLRQLAQAQPRAIGYDVLFVDPDPTTGADTALAQAMHAAGSVFLPLSVEAPGLNGQPYQVTLPVQPLLAAAGVGSVNVEFDPDGTVRSSYLQEGDQASRWPDLMELVYRAAEGHDSRPFMAPPGHTYGPGQLVRDKPLLISFAGSGGAFRTVSFVDAMRGQTPPAFFRDKLVLVGATADGLGDRYATPLSGGIAVMPGVELQANVLNTLLQGGGIVPLSRFETLALSLTALWFLLAGFLVFHPQTNMLLGVGLLGAVMATSAGLFICGNIWFAPTTAVIGLLLVYPLWSWRRLKASSAYMAGELRQFSNEPDLLSLLSGGAAGLPGDVIDRQIYLMHRIIDQKRTLRRFVTDVLHELPDATLVTGLDDQVQLANREAERLFAPIVGRSLTGRSIRELSAHFRRTVVPPVAAEGDAEGPEFELTAPDGHCYDTRRTALHNVRGEAIGWIVRFTDVTALRAEGRQRERFLELLTHDMRSPQVSILALLDGIASGDITPEQSDRIAAHARRTLALADDFVQLARAEMPRYATRLTNLSDIVIEAADELWARAVAKRLTILTEGCEQEYLVMAEPGLLTRAFINIVDNAVKSTPPGGRISCRLQLAPSGPAAVCTIRDSGSGMSADQLNHLLRRFGHAPVHGPYATQGVGLGLALAHTVIARHGGSITCDSELGVGTTFTVTLPLYPHAGDANPTMIERGILSS
jgi:CHASE2 domain-containing sensor protein/signal transduction histidine kinase